MESRPSIGLAVAVIASVIIGCLAGAVFWYRHRLFGKAPGLSSAGELDPVAQLDMVSNPVFATTTSATVGAWAVSDVAPTEAAAPRYGDLGTARAPQDGGAYTELGDGPTPADATHGAYRVISPTYSTERPRAIAGEASYAVLGALTATNRRGGVPEGGYQTLGQVRALSADEPRESTHLPNPGREPGRDLRKWGKLQQNRCQKYH